MGSVQRLTIVITLTVGVLGLWVPTTVAASPYASHTPKSLHKSFAPDDAGYTEYNTADNTYKIHDTKADSLAVGVLFYSQNHRESPLEFVPCKGGANSICGGQLTSTELDKVKMLCMETAVEKGLDADKNGPDARNFYYEKYECFPLPQREDRFG